MTKVRMNGGRHDLSVLNDEEYREYKRAYEAKRQKKWRKKMRTAGILVASDVGGATRELLNAFNKSLEGDCDWAEFKGKVVADLPHDQPS